MAENKIARRDSRWNIPPKPEWDMGAYLAAQATASLVVRLLLTDAAALRMEGSRALVFYP